MIYVDQDQHELLWYDLAVTGEASLSSHTWEVSQYPTGATWTLGTPSTFSETGIIGSKVLFGKVSIVGIYKLTAHLVGATGAEYERTAIINVTQL